MDKFRNKYSRASDTATIQQENPFQSQLNSATIYRIHRVSSRRIPSVLFGQELLLSGFINAVSAASLRS